MTTMTRIHPRTRSFFVPSFLPLSISFFVSFSIYIYIFPSLCLSSSSSSSMSLSVFIFVSPDERTQNKITTRRKILFPIFATVKQLGDGNKSKKTKITTIGWLLATAVQRQFLRRVAQESCGHPLVALNRLQRR